MSQFRQKYRDTYDALLMDDIQFIAGKVSTQEEFFHTFNSLHSSHRQIVVTSDKSPKDIPGLEERIRTRFEWGLIADIQPPEIETRIAILRAKAESDDLFLPNDVALFLASNIKSNVRELEGALLNLGAQASLLGVEISLDLAKNELKSIIKQATETIAVDTIFDIVASHFEIKVSDLKGKERSRKMTLPRQISMYLIRKYCEKSFSDIGILLGGKDHSTVQHGVRTIMAEILSKSETKRHIEAIQNKL
jgi:chromosomal replication initiator protein